MSSPVVVVVVPCYNTSVRCATAIAGARAVADAVLAVDDGSTDDTSAHLKASGCRTVTLPVNSGKGAALAAGFRAVLAGSDGVPGVAIDYVVTMDGDGQHEPRDIPRLVACAARTRADLVLGIRDRRAMPRKNRIGAHYSRLLFLIGTCTFVPDTQSGFRLLSAPLVAALLDRVTWKGYESESEVLWRTLALGRPAAAVPISTIYLDDNRGSQFSAWRDSRRIAAVFTRSLRWTIGMAALDFAAFSAIVSLGWLAPVPANLASRAFAVAAQATFRRDYAARTRGLMRKEGLGGVLLTFAGHLALTTMLLAGLGRLGAPPVAAKALAQLVGYLTTFAAVDFVLLRRASRDCSAIS